MRIRNAVAEDLTALSGLAESFHAEVQLPARFERRAFIKSWEKLLSSRAGTIFVSEDNQAEMKAMLGALIFPDINSSDLVATEMFWYADKSSRGCGLALFSAFERWAKESGAKRAIMVHLSNSMPEKLRRFYLKKGYHEVETNYIKEIN